MPIREIIRLPVTWVLSLLVMAITAVWTLSMLDTQNRIEPLKERLDRIENKLDLVVEKASKVEGMEKDIDGLEEKVQYLTRRSPYEN